MPQMVHPRIAATQDCDILSRPLLEAWSSRGRCGRRTERRGQPTHAHGWATAMRRSWGWWYQWWAGAVEDRPQFDVITLPPSGSIRGGGHHCGYDHWA
jgi:hypothetical protein